MSARSRVSPPESSSEGAVGAGWLANRPSRPRRGEPGCADPPLEDMVAPQTRHTGARSRGASTSASACGAAVGHRAVARSRHEFLFEARRALSISSRSTWRSSLARSVVYAPLTPHGARRRSSQPPGRASSRPGTHQSIARRARPPRCTRPRAPSTRASPRARPRPRPPRRRRRRGDRRRGASPRPPVRSSARAAASAAAPRALPLSLPQTSSPARAPVRPSGPRCTPSSTAWAFVR